MKTGKKNILIIMGRYLPGYKDGGPVRTIKNLVDSLGDEYNFKILTCDRDHGDQVPYPNVIVNNWNKIGNAEVYYVSPRGFKIKIIRILAKQVDLIYICGCFNDYAIKALFLKRLGLLDKPVVIASMGLFSPSGFKLKYKKKKSFTSIFNFIGMFKNIYWSATSEIEVQEINQQIETNNNIFIAEDLPRRVEEIPLEKFKEVGEVKVVWISRIAPNKNLIGAIQILQRVKSKVEFTIYGPIHLPKYWDECQVELAKLPSNVNWKYCGMIESELVVNTLRGHHVFLFPTYSENYGHVIQEAMSAGCVTVISNQTPWKNLEKHGIGYVYSINEVETFAKVIDRYADMNQKEFQVVSNKVLAYAIVNSNNKVENTGYRKIFSVL